MDILEQLRALEKRRKKASGVSSLNALVTARDIGQLRERKKASLERFVPGRVVENDLGRFFLLSETYPADYLQGIQLLPGGWIPIGSTDLPLEKGKLQTTGPIWFIWTPKPPVWREARGLSLFWSGWGIGAGGGRARSSSSSSSSCGITMKSLRSWRLWTNASRSSSSRDW
jgi:hypothetical protein